MVSLVVPLVIVRGPWITTQGFSPRNAGDTTRPTLQPQRRTQLRRVLVLGHQWEGLRSHWFSRFGLCAEAEKALARLSYLEQKYADKVKQDHS